jgi:hypothetical protein
MEMLRHVAKLANTDQRCVVAWMQIPNREDHALVIPVDNLPARLEQAVMDVLRSPEGQNEETFAMVLSRNLMPDTGEDLLKTLHSTNRLVAVPVSQVLMMPRPNQPVKLSTVLEQLGRLPRQDGLLEQYAETKFNPHVANQQAESAENNRSIARNLLVEAEMLEADARRKREQAYGYDGSLRPKVVGNGHARLEAVPPLEAERPILPLGDVQTAPVVEPIPVVEPPEQNAELLAMMSKLIERVEVQDKLLSELQGRLQEHPTEPKHVSRRSRSAHS